MTVQQITDSESMARQRLLLEYAEAKAEGFRRSAVTEAVGGLRANARAYIDLEQHFVKIAAGARGVLMRASGVSADDAEQLAEINALTHQINDEPPRTLVPLVAFLRERLGRVLPWVASETWQTIGMLLLRGRP